MNYFDYKCGKKEEYKGKGKALEKEEIKLKIKRRNQKINNNPIFLKEL